MSRYTNDLDAVGDMLNNTVLQIISSVITVVGTLGLMLYTNVWLTIVTVVMVPLMMKVGGAVAGKSRKFYQAQQAAIGTLNGYIEETMTCLLYTSYPWKFHRIFHPAAISAGVRGADDFTENFCFL